MASANGVATVGPVAGAAATFLPPEGTLAQQRVSLRFTDAADEAAYQSEQWQAIKLRVRVASLALAVFCLTITLDYNFSDFSADRLLIAVLVSCRVLPTLVLCAMSFCDGRWVARRWSALSAAAVLLVSLSVSLHAFLCSHGPAFSAASSSPQCRALGAGVDLPWLPLTCAALFPGILAFGLCAAWQDVLWSTLAADVLFAGLVLSAPSHEFVATAVVLAVTALVVCAQARYAQDSELRASFRREAAATRRLASVLAVNRAVEAQLAQRLGEILRRSNVMMSEVIRGGIVTWVSSGCRGILGAAPGDLLLGDTLRWVHREDTLVFQQALDLCMAAGAAAPPGASRSAPLRRSCQVQFRRQRANGESVWVHAEVHAIGRSSAATAAAAGAGGGGQFSSVLLIESDLSDEQRRAASTGAPYIMSPALLPLVLSAAAPAAPPTPAAPSSASSGTTARVTERTLTSVASRPVMVPLPYDAYFERTLYTALASACVSASTLASALSALRQGVPSVAAASASVIGLPLSGRPTEDSLALSLYTGGDDVLNQGAAATFPQSRPLSLTSIDFRDEPVPLRALRTSSACVAMAISDAISVARLRSAHLPVREDVEIDLRDLVDEAAVLARFRTPLTADAPPFRASVDPEIPPRALLDPVRTRALIELMLTAALDAASRGGGKQSGGSSVELALYLEKEASSRQAALAGPLVRQQLTAPPPQQQQQPHLSNPVPRGDAGGLLCLSVSFDTRRAGGVAAVTAALSADPLRADAGGAFAPVPTTDVHSPPSSCGDVAAAASSFANVLPLVRHTALCLGGVVDIYAAAAALPHGSAAGAADSPGASDACAVIVVKIPLHPIFRPTVPGLTAPDPAAVRAAIDAAPVHSVPFALPAHYTLVSALPGAALPAGSMQRGLARPPSGALPPMPPRRTSIALGSPALPVRSMTDRADDASSSVVGAHARGGGGIPAAASSSSGQDVVLPGVLNTHHLLSIESSGGGCLTPKAATAPPPVQAPVPGSPAMAPSARPSVGGQPVAGGSGAAASGSSGSQSPAMHVLLVDDEATNRRLGARLLARLGCTFELLEDGDEILPHLRAPGRSLAVDVILLDIIMERSDGVAVCRNLRAEGIDVPIIAVTGTAGAEDLPRFQAAGFDLVVSKPFNLQDIARALAVGRAIRGGLEGGNVGATA